MAAMNFPSSPVNGQTYTNPDTGVTYTYNSAEGKWKTTVTSNAFLPLSGGTLTGALNVTNIKHPSSASNDIVLDASGNVSIDAGTLYVDASNNRVGIGTTSPDSLIEAVDSAPGIVSTIFRVRNSGTTAGTESRLLLTTNTSSTQTRVSAGLSCLALNTSGNTALLFGTASGGTYGERARIDSSGRLLVGTSTSTTVQGVSGQLQLQSSNYTDILTKSFGAYGAIRIARANGSSSSPSIVSSGNTLGSIYWHGYDGSNYDSFAAGIEAQVDGTPGAGDMPGRLVFSTTSDGAASPTERMRITNEGFLKVSDNNTYVTAGSGPYHEINSVNGSGAALLLYNRSAANAFGYYYQSTNADPNDTNKYVFRAIQNTGVNVYTIWSNGTVSARSDVKYKKNIESARDGYLEDLSQLRVVKYNWYNHDDTTPKELGFIAQEVEEVFPGLVMSEPEKDQDNNETGEFCKSIKTSVFTPMLVKALQEAHDKIKQLEARLSALEAQ